ncbi:hypothetical protein [uncultured Finegoldia sp.]|uniref:hypothetical protein n=1 Tax=uncultured Finegoldia sp. TaxID=328009 RepID=UPI0026266A6B|nr:hypothetical protein [uncultured Finegoldia sp.]
MEIKKGTKLIQKKTKQAIIEFVLKNYVIYVFEGKYSDFDILVKYSKDSTRLRTPKHIHWVVDVLMKMQGNHKLTRSFLKSIQSCWHSCKPLSNNDYITLKNLIENGENEIDIKKYSSLNDFGEYDVEFLYVLMELLAVQEKTNRADAYIFGEIIEKLLDENVDIFKIISKAGFRGRRG